MAKLQNRGSILACLGVLAALASPSAMAGGNVTITFTNDIPVPLDHWSSVLAFGMIAIAAYFLLRRQGSFGRLWHWVVMAVVAGGGAYGLWQHDLIGTAYAGSSNDMDASPFNGYASCDSTPSPYPFANATGQTIRITAVTWGNITPCTPMVPATTPQCAPGVTLAPGTSCYLELRDNSPA